MKAKVFSGLATKLLLVCVVTGCSTMSITPVIPAEQQPTLLVKGPLQYSGKAEYQPRTVSHDSSAGFGMGFRYATIEKQDRSGWDLLALFNPLTILGFPTGDLTSTVTGTLEVIRDGQVIKAYTAMCISKASRGFYYGEDFSELRRNGLLAVRDNIEAQMSLDHEFYKVAGSKGVLQ